MFINFPVNKVLLSRMATAADLAYKNEQKSMFDVPYNPDPATDLVKAGLCYMTMPSGKFAYRMAEPLVVKACNSFLLKSSDLTDLKSGILVITPPFIFKRNESA